MLQFRQSILKEEKLSYVGAGMQEHADVVDCSAGYNPYGAPQAAVEALRGIDAHALNLYPHGQGLQRAIAGYWRPYAPISPENIILTDGSIGGIYLVNSAFAWPGARMLALAPQFSDYINHAKLLGIEYRAFLLRAKDGYRVDWDAFAAQIDDGLRLVYLDHPNNPTGQAAPMEALRMLAYRAQQRGVCLLVDEAYGDYMEPAQSACTLLGEFKNIIVLRTFSKGFGMAGIRAGYLLAGEEVCRALNKISNPYNISQPSRLAAQAALGEADFLPRCRAAFAGNKAAMRAAIGEKLHMAHTLDACPICLVYHTDTHVDLEEALRKRGVLSYSGAHFDGLGVNAVRLRAPHERECGRVVQALAELNKEEST